MLDRSKKPRLYGRARDGNRSLKPLRPYTGSSLEPYFDLSALPHCDHIAVQCPDIPSADSLAAAWGLFRFFQASGKKVRLFHMGTHDALPPNVREMLVQLEAPLEHGAAASSRDGLVFAVSGGVSALSRVSAQETILVGNHMPEGTLPRLSDVRPYLSCCSTLVWRMLEQAGFAIDEKLGTAFVYGLYTETNGFKEIRFPLDRDMRDILPVNKRLFAALERANLALADLAVAAKALDALDYHAEERFVLINVLPCDGSVLGFVSDLAMRVSAVDSAIVFSETEENLRFCTRSAVREIQASHLASWLVRDLGSSGGNRENAGGMISSAGYDALHAGRLPADFFLERMRAYLAAYDLIDCSTAGPINAQGARAHQKRPVPLGYVHSVDLAAPGSCLRIRMLEGDIVIPADADTFLMIGLAGEVYPIKGRIFEKKYSPGEKALERRFVYPPVVMQQEKGKGIPLLRHAKTCISREDRVLARQLKRGVKLFTAWDADNYLLGEPGDWLVQIKNDPSDQYIVKADIFPQLYDAVR